MVIRPESAEDISKFSSAVEAYMRSGGLHIQFNIMSYQDLLEARKNPELHPELLVRVSGYSAYFKDLNAAMQDRHDPDISALGRHPVRRPG